MEWGGYIPRNNYQYLHDLIGMETGKDAQYSVHVRPLDICYHWLVSAVPPSAGSWWSADQSAGSA